MKNIKIINQKLSDNKSRENENDKKNNKTNRYYILATTLFFKLLSGSFSCYILKRRQP